MGGKTLEPRNYWNTYPPVFRGQKYDRKTEAERKMEQNRRDHACEQREIREEQNKVWQFLKTPIDIRFILNYPPSPPFQAKQNLEWKSRAILLNLCGFPNTIVGSCNIRKKKHFLSYKWITKNHNDYCKEEGTKCRKCENRNK